MNVYEVELRVKQRATGEERLTTRTEHAYSVTDAAMQAVLNQAAAETPGTVDIVLAHIGPPTADVLAATSNIAEALMRRDPSIVRSLDAFVASGGKQI